MTKANVQPFAIEGQLIQPGQRVRLSVAMPALYTNTELSIPVEICHGKKPGPVMFICAAIHGDELNGIEIIARVLGHKSIARLQGTLIAIPMVNVYGVLNQSRYMPDRRDLNRSFPGDENGSLAGRVAHLFLDKIVKRCDYGIDLHTGAIHRSNLPQIRANLDDAETLSMAKAFAMPVVLNSDIRDGSLRESATSLGVRILVYEAGEALRYDELSIRAGVKGVLNVLRYLQMLPASKSKGHEIAPYIARNSVWIRSPESGFISHIAQLGDHVAKGQILAEVKDPYGKPLGEILSAKEGIIIGKQNIPLTQSGEAVYHLAYFSAPDSVAEHVELLTDNLALND